MDKKRRRVEMVERERMEEVEEETGEVEKGPWVPTPPLKI